ncbi:MAG: hypothetical protein ACTHJL_04640 [Amnibacterium sp.]
MPDGPFDAPSLEAIGELLALAQREHIGITFTPGPDGWTIGYVRGMGADDLVTGAELGATARAAVAPLLEVAASYASTVDTPEL